MNAVLRVPVPVPGKYRFHIYLATDYIRVKRYGTGLTQGQLCVMQLPRLVEEPAGETYAISIWRPVTHALKDMAYVSPNGCTRAGSLPVRAGQLRNSCNISAAPALTGCPSKYLLLPVIPERPDCTIHAATGGPGGSLRKFIAARGQWKPILPFKFRAVSLPGRKEVSIQALKPYFYNQPLRMTITRLPSNR